MRHKFLITLELASGLLEEDDTEEFILEVLEEIKKNHLHAEEEIRLVDVKTAYN